jgi:hypothetical protein
VISKTQYENRLILYPRFVFVRFRERVTMWSGGEIFFCEKAFLGEFSESTDIPAEGHFAELILY